MEKINVIDIRLVNGKPLKAFADIQLNNGWIIKDFRVIQQPGHKAYMVAPQTTWKGPQGKLNFKPIVSMPDDVKWQVEVSILTAFQKANEVNDERTI